MLKYGDKQFWINLNTHTKTVQQLIIETGFPDVIVRKKLRRHKLTYLHVHVGTPFGAIRSKLNNREFWLALHPETKTMQQLILEVGVGKGCISKYLKKFNLLYIKLDTTFKPNRENPNKGKTLEEIYGGEKAQQITEVLKSSHLGQPCYRKGKTWEELFGKERAMEMKERNRAVQVETHSSEKYKEEARRKRLTQTFPFNGTSIELSFRKALTERGVSFEANKTIIGKTQPDIFIAPNICIYLDGCFWHKCYKCFDWQKSKASSEIRKAINKKYYQDKSLNVLLPEFGYKVLRFWEHEINTKLDSCVAEVLQNVQI